MLPGGAPDRAARGRRPRAAAKRADGGEPPDQIFEDGPSDFAARIVPRRVVRRMISHPRPDIGSERPREEKAFNRGGGYSGQDEQVREEELRRREVPSGTVAARPQDAGEGPGERASFDPATGATRGSGAGPTEEFDTDDPTMGAGKRGGAEG